MCGIAGAVFWDGTPAGVDPLAVVRAMTDALAHRGPDGSGVVACVTSQAEPRAPVAVLGHRRLAIIDLTDRAVQPMKSLSAPIWLTYNGETYNFAALRRELQGAGQVFASDSDTEVVLHGYDRWGEDVVDRLRGMFAFGIWDGRRQRLMLARDRFGIKPLYVHRGDRHILFASELRAILASGLVPRRLDAGALDQFLAYQSAPPPRTLVEGVEMLEPAQAAIFEMDRPSRVRQYWHLLDAAAPGAAIDPAAARARTRELLAESAALHMVSDVPVGVFLSGGIDSSALVALVRRSGAVPRTFTVSCAGTPFDEGAYARAVAEAFETEHHELVLTEDDLLGRLPAALSSVDHPSGDGINTFVIASAVREAGVKVALSGLGGDELFGGYPSFRRLDWLARAAPMWGPSSRIVRHAAAAAVRSVGASVAAEKAAAVLETDGSLPQAFPVMRRLFTPAQRRALIGGAAAQSTGDGDPYVALLSQARGRAEAGRRMAFVSYAEARTYMHDVLLRDTDQMSMAHGLEIRVPLLDHHLVEHVIALPDAIKRQRRSPKPLLVGSLGVELPAVVRRPKQGFVLPFSTWMKHGLRDLCEHSLGPSGLAGRSIFSSVAIADLWRAFLAGDRRTSWSRPWTLVALNVWLEQNRISS
jgi:asparagine synthase (glutamine-hydrolysing)